MSAAIKTKGKPPAEMTPHSTNSPTTFTSTGVCANVFVSAWNRCWCSSQAKPVPHERNSLKYFWSWECDDPHIIVVMIPA